MACKMLVDRVVDNFPDAMMESRPVVRISEIHTWSFADRFQSFEYLDAVCTITFRHNIHLFLLPKIMVLSGV
jgi:hypothetical protein